MTTKVSMILSAFILASLPLGSEPSGTTSSEGKDFMQPLKDGNKYKNWIETKLMEGRAPLAAFSSFRRSDPRSRPR